MIKFRLVSCVIAAAIAIGALVIPDTPARSEPAREKVTFQLALAGKMKAGDDLLVEDAAVIDEATVVLVGTTGDEDHLPPLDMGEPNGAIVDLGKKSSRKFTNGHKVRLRSVSVSKGRIATACNFRDPLLRIWGLKAGKTVAEIEIEKVDGDNRNDYRAAWFHKSDRIAIAVDDWVIVLDPARPDTRTVFSLPKGRRGWLDKPVLSADDTRIACTAGLNRDGSWDKTGLVFWDVESRKATALSLLPEKADEPEQWHSGGAVLGPKGMLIAWRHGSVSEVPDKVAEADAPIDRRGVVRIDTENGKVIPLGIGQTGYTLSCAVDQTGTWLATAGSSRPDKARTDGGISVGELRVYHLPTNGLAFREQMEGLPLKWVAFTPSGKRIVAATYDGVLRWWDVKDK